jgi:DNA polymerase-3 subunit beta
LYFNIPRKELLNPLKTAVSVVEQRQTLPILANVLVQVKDNALRLMATDAEVEIICTIPLEANLSGDNEGETTLPARKFFDIVRSVNDNSTIQITVDEEDKAVIKAGKSRFTLSCLPAEDFPSSPQIEETCTFNLSQRTFKELIEQTSYAMGQNDVRYYLNGICLDLRQDGKLVVVATDGHRLSMAEEEFELPNNEPMQVIIPNKAIKELMQMLEGGDSELTILIDNNHIKFIISDSITLTSKLIDGKYPDYQNVIPTAANKVVIVDVATLKAAFNQSAILSSDKVKGVRLSIGNHLMKVSSRNSDQEEAEIDCEVDYDGEELEIGFNVKYLLDALSIITTQEVELHFTNNDSSCMILPREIDSVKGVIMPMRL